MKVIINRAIPRPRAPSVKWWRHPHRNGGGPDTRNKGGARPPGMPRRQTARVKVFTPEYHYKYNNTVSTLLSSMSNYPLLDVIQYAKEGIHPATMTMAVIMLVAFVVSQDDTLQVLLGWWRQFKGKIGGFLLQVGSQRMLDNSGLIKKQMVIPKSGLTVPLLRTKSNG